MKKIIALIVSFSVFLPWANSQNLVSDTITIEHFTINLDIVYLSQKSISGYSELKIKSKQNGVNVLSLDLLRMTIDSVKIDNQSVTQWTYNDTLLRISLPQSINTGDSLIAAIYYHGQPVKDPSGWGGFYFSNDSSYAFNLGVGFHDNPHNYGRVWYPCIDDFHDRATYDFNIRVKDGKTAVCNGTLENVTSDTVSGTKLYQWKLHNTVPSYLTSVAVGSYVAVQDTFQGQNGPVPIAIYVPQSKVNAAIATFSRLKQILAAYEWAYGPYQWERVGYVGVPFNSGAMEHATNIAIGLGYINGNNAYESLYAHELSHHWFGDLVTCNSAPEMWINEGWAVFSESMYREILDGKPYYKNQMRSLLKRVITQAHIDDNGYWSLNNVPHEHTYGTTVYDKGATVAHSIRGYLGDSLFFSMLRAYFSQKAFTHISNTGFRDFISAQTGINMNDFFDAWVFQPGFVHFSIDSFNVQPLGNKYLVKVYMRQKLWHKPQYANSNRVWVRAANNQWQFADKMVKFSGATGMDTMIVDFIPDFLMTDPDEKLADATVDKMEVIDTTGLKYLMNSYFRLNVNSIKDSALFRITHNWSAPDTLGTNLPGLKLSTHRYWTVEGIFPQDFDATGQFYYSKFSELDNDLITNPQDSLVILWRRGAGDPWHKVDFERKGSWTTGFFHVRHLKQGEYSVAVWDKAYAGLTGTTNSEQVLKLSPNPSSGSLTIETGRTDNWYIKVYDDSGKHITNIFSNGNKSLNFDASLYIKKGGVYFFMLFDAKDNFIENKKFVFIR